MKRTIKSVLLIGLLAILAVSVAACGGNDVSDSPLVGQWSWPEGPDFVYTFEADGTGSRGIPGQMETFNW